jgi:hypothetical protein
VTDQHAPTGASSDTTREVVTARVNVARWWFAAALGAVTTVLLACALIGVPPELFDEPSPMMVWLRVLTVVGVPVGAFGAWFYAKGARRPQHVKIDENGISTPDWTLDWTEVRAADVLPAPSARPHKQQLAFLVTDEAFARVRQANRWHSGRPFQMGGLPATLPIVRTQGDTRPSPVELLPHVQAHLRAGHRDGDGNQRHW